MIESVDMKKNSQETDFDTICMLRRSGQNYFAGDCEKKSIGRTHQSSKPDICLFVIEMNNTVVMRCQYPNFIPENKIAQNEFKQQRLYFERKYLG